MWLLKKGESASTERFGHITTSASFIEKPETNGVMSHRINSVCILRFALLFDIDI